MEPQKTLNSQNYFDKEQRHHPDIYNNVNGTWGHYSQWSQRKEKWPVIEENNRMGKIKISSRKLEIATERFMQRWAE